MSNYLDNAGLTNVLVKIKSLLATKASITAIPTKVSSLENDSEYQTSSDVASAIPKNVSELTNDAGYQTAGDVTGAIPKNVSAFTNDSGYQTASDVTSKIPTKVSELTNDSGYLTNASLSVPTKVSELENDSNYQTDTEVSEAVDVGLRSTSVIRYDYSATHQYSDYYISSVGKSSGSINYITYRVPIADKVKLIVSDLQTAGTIPTSDSVASQIATALDGVTGIEFVVVDSLPATPTKGTIYLVPKGTYDSNSVTVNQTDDSGNTVTDVMQDSYDEYIWVSESTTDGVTTYNYEKIGSTDVDLSQYAKAADVPTKTSELTNDSGFVTSVPTKTSELENDSGYLQRYSGSSQLDGREESETRQTIVYDFSTTSDELIPIKIYRNNVTDTEVDGQYVSAVSQTNDKISVSRKALPSVNDTATSGQYVSAVSQSNGEISVTRANLPSFTDSAVDGKYVSSVSQSGGKITVTRADLPSGGSTDTPIPNETIDSIFTEVFG